jgi:DNA-binding transcriptional LysR family regulator
VTLRQLRYFAVLGEELNYRRAAERLFITQPALSTAIKQLEHQLGVMLFTRTTREVSLTELGQAWLPKVGDALRGIDAAVDDLIDMSAHYRRIRLGYLIGTGADLLFRLMRHFEAAYPEITLEPREFDFSDPTAGLADGTTEVAIIRPPVDLPEPRLQQGRIGRDHQAMRGHVTATGVVRQPDGHPRIRKTQGREGFINAHPPGVHLCDPVSVGIPAA